MCVEFPYTKHHPKPNTNCIQTYSYHHYNDDDDNDYISDNSPTWAVWVFAPKRHEFNYVRPLIKPSGICCTSHIPISNISFTPLIWKYAETYLKKTRLKNISDRGFLIALIAFPNGVLAAPHCTLKLDVWLCGSSIQCVYFSFSIFIFFHFAVFFYLPLESEAGIKIGFFF